MPEVVHAYISLRVGKSLKVKDAGIRRDPAVAEKIGKTGEPT